MNSIEKLTEYFRKFPGIGERQAGRFVSYILHAPESYARELSQTILAIKNTVIECAECHRFFEKNHSAICQYCTKAEDTTHLLIIEKDSDLENIHHARVYTGKYFVLGGLIPILEKKSSYFIRIDQLLKTVEERSLSEKKLTEVIFSFSLTPQGLHTENRLKDTLSLLQKKYGFTLTSLGRGVSTGADIEYLDPDTLKNALESRR
jgi:recombination protein RecR